MLQSALALLTSCVGACPTERCANAKDGRSSHARPRSKRKAVCVRSVNRVSASQTMDAINFDRDCNFQTMLPTLPKAEQSPPPNR